MKYIYDIDVNLKKEFINFYEWTSNDKITNLKKVKTYKIDNKMYYDILKYEIEIKDEIKDDIILFCNDFDLICIKFENGKSVMRSKIAIEEEVSILQIMFKDKITKFEYKLLDKIEYNFHNRIEIEKINKINEFINDNKTNIDILKYLSYEWFDREIKDYNKFYNEINAAESEKIDKFYETIKNIEINA